jgi:hypothetical protein
MTSYTPKKINLTDYQLRKLGNAIINGNDVILTIKPTQNNNGHTLHLTERQIKRLEKAMKDNKNIRIKLSKAQLASQPHGSGLFDSIIKLVPKVLPFLTNVVAPLGLAGATGAISGLANRAVQKKKGTGIVRAGQEGGTVKLSPSTIKEITSTVKKLEQHNVVPAGLSEAVLDKIKQQDGGFIGTLLASLAGPLLSALLGGNGITRAGTSNYLN